MQGYNVILSAFVELSTIDMALLLNQAAIHHATTILAECVEVHGRTLFTEQANRQGHRSASRACKWCELTTSTRK